MLDYDFQMSKQIPIIAVELDGCLGVRTLGEGNLFIPYQWRVVPGVSSLLDQLATRAYILLHTIWISEENGTDLETQCKAIQRWMQDARLPWDWIWWLPGKPYADFYVESKEGLEHVLQEIEDSD